MAQTWTRYLSACGIAIALGAISLSTTLPAIASTSLPDAELSQTSASTPSKLKQDGDKIRDLNLTDAQKQQIRTIRQDTRQKLEAVLTNEQRAQIQQAKQSGQNPRDIMKSINLTNAQRQQIQAIRQNSYQQIQSILTDEQRAKLEQMRANYRSNPDQ
ncbi:hypothetical protein TUMEXPCC7403_16230 [Tumidithrix helvetica PCC 7403]|uniref:hypothetical protein n=1 Tax=Tumidithrix helvetica TaxID=3457545 RepID=UPI003CA2A48D